MNTRVTLNQTDIALGPDPTRVVMRFFVPGREDFGPGDSRASPVIERILGLDEDVVKTTMSDIDDRFLDRHRDLHATFGEHASMVSSRIGPGVDLSPARTLLLGATFTREFSIEAAALCNPSIVPHPAQDDDGSARFILSARSIGEGHKSTISFRSGVVTASGTVTVDAPGPFPGTASPTGGRHNRAVFQSRLGALDEDRGNAAYVLGGLPRFFDDEELDARIHQVASDATTRPNVQTTLDHLRTLSQACYRVDFDDRTEISEQVLWPHGPFESHGMEDARFVRFTENSGQTTYHATYTGYDGANICVQMIETADFKSFDIKPTAGAAAVGKGLALFPRQVNGRYVALSRSDRETNAIAFSDDLYCWDRSETIQRPERPWELIQLGNCGSPIETNAGWLVLTHGVGPMRTYSLGAILLDLADPRTVLAATTEPILMPTEGQREGYVPNVLYTCGAMAHGDILVIPYAVADQRIAIATLSINEMLHALASGSG